MTAAPSASFATVRRFVQIAALALLACVTAHWASGGGAALLVWPASAVAFAFGWRYGRLWTLPAALGAGFWGLSVTGSTGFALICALSAIPGAILALTALTRLAEWRPVEHRRQAISRFLLAALLLAAAADAAVFAVGSHWLGTALAAPGPADPGLAQAGLVQAGAGLLPVFIGAWLIDAAGLLIVTPAVLAFVDDASDPDASYFGARLFDLPAVALGLLIAASAFLIGRAGGPTSLAGNWAPLLLFFAFPLLAWSAARLGERSHALTALLIALPLLASQTWQTPGPPVGVGLGNLLGGALAMAPPIAPGPPLTQALWVTALLVAAALSALLLQAVCADWRLATNRVAQQSRRDMTTGLLNDRGLLAEISDHLVAADRGSLGLVSLHLSNFEAVGELCGAVEAIQLEQACSELLRRQPCLRFAARVAPGRYVIVVSAETVAQVRAIARELYSQLNGQLFQTDHGSLRLQCCAGGLLLDRHTVITSEDCLSALADAANIAASVRDPRIFVEPLSQMMIDARRTQQGKIEHIREAIRDNRIELHAQLVNDPDAPPGTRSFELLTRLRDRDGSLIQPPEFLGLAAQAQLSIPLDRAVVRRAFEWLSEHPKALSETWKCSINLSGATMSDGSIAEHIREQRAHFGIPASQIVFEITESEAIRNPAAASRLVDDLKQQGFGIALDDFGTGLATFEYLKRFPLDYLKIDGSFIRNLMSNPIDEEIVISTIRVAARLQLRTIAEHVHSSEICERLRALGIDRQQGDFFGKPVPLAEIFLQPMPAFETLGPPGTWASKPSTADTPAS